MKLKNGKTITIEDVIIIGYVIMSLYSLIVTADYFFALICHIGIVIMTNKRKMRDDYYGFLNEWKNKEKGTLVALAIEVATLIAVDKIYPLLNNNYFIERIGLLCIVGRDLYYVKEYYVKQKGQQYGEKDKE